MPRLVLTRMSTRTQLCSGGAARAYNALKNFRVVATRFEKRAYVFHGTVTLASIRLRLRP